MGTFKKMLLLLGFLFVAVFAYLGYKYLNLKEQELTGTVATASTAPSNSECFDPVSGKMYNYYVSAGSANVRVDAGTAYSVASTLSRGDMVLKLAEKTVAPDPSQPVTQKEILFTTATASFTLPINMTVRVVDMEGDSPMVRVAYTHPELGELEARVPKDTLDLDGAPKLWYHIRAAGDVDGWVSRRLLADLEAC